MASKQAEQEKLTKEADRLKQLEINAEMDKLRKINEELMKQLQN
jgi:hypothetical protein